MKVRSISASISVTITYICEFFDEYLVDRCWMVTHGHHFDDRLSLSHMSHDDDDDDDDDTVTMHWRMVRPRISGLLHMTQVIEATSKTDCPKHFWPPYVETHKDIATKSGETHVQDRAQPSCKFWCRSARDSLPIFGQQMRIFLIFLGGYTIHFQQAVVELMLRSNWHLTLQLPFSKYWRFRGPKFWILRIP